MSTPNPPGKASGNQANEGTLGTGASLLTGQPITSEQGWAQLMHTFGRKMPQRLTASAKARRSLQGLSRGKGF